MGTSSARRTISHSAISLRDPYGRAGRRRILNSTGDVAFGPIDAKPFRIEVGVSGPEWSMPIVRAKTARLRLLLAGRSKFLMGALPIDSSRERGLDRRKKIGPAQCFERHVLISLLKLHFLDQLFGPRENAFKLVAEPPSRFRRQAICNLPSLCAFFAKDMPGAGPFSCLASGNVCMRRRAPPSMVPGLNRGECYPAPPTAAGRRFRCC